MHLRHFAQHSPPLLCWSFLTCVGTSPLILTLLHMALVGLYSKIRAVACNLWPISARSSLGPNATTPPMTVSSWLLLLHLKSGAITLMASAPEWSQTTLPSNTCIPSHICPPAKYVGCSSWSSTDLTMCTVLAGRLQSLTFCPASPPLWWSLAGLHVWHVPSILIPSCLACSPVHVGMTPRSICVGEGTPLSCTMCPMGVSNWCYLRQGDFASLCCLSCMTASWEGTWMPHVLWLRWHSGCGGPTCPLM